MSLKNKKILVTAGPTWVAIDKVRIMTNIFSGRTGAGIASDLQKKGAKVKLLLGPGRVMPPKGLKVERFYYFDELYKLMKKEISSKKYDIVIHSAAVSDYEPIKKQAGKISSGKKSLSVKLKPTPKIIQQIKKWDKNVFLIQFKLEVGKTKKQLIDVGYKSMIKNKADLVVVNDFNKISDTKHEAWVVDGEKVVNKVANKSELVSSIERLSMS